MRTKFAAAGLLLALLLTPLLSACASRTAGSATEMALCDQFKPILWSDADSDKTIAQAKQANAVGARLCGWRP